jgi:hypothetical protein
MQKRSRCTFCREYTVETFVRTRSIGWHMIMQLNAFLTLLLCGPLIPEALLGPLVTPEGDRREHCDTHLPCASCFALATHLHPDQLGKDTACLLAQCSRATAPRSRIKPIDVRWLFWGGPIDASASSSAPLQSLPRFSRLAVPNASLPIYFPFVLVCCPSRPAIRRPLH